MFCRHESVAAVIPADDIALEAAVLFQQIHQVIMRPLEKTVHNTWHNIMCLKQIIANRFDQIFGSEVVAALSKPNMAAYFTGDLDISSITKIIALVLAITDDTYAKIDTQILARALYSLDAYHFIKSKDNIDRDGVIKQIMEIDFDECRTVPAEPFEPEPVIITFNDSYDLEHISASAASYHNEYDKITNFMHFLIQFRKSNSIEQLVTLIKTPIVPSTIYGFDPNMTFDTFLAANTLQALQCTKLEHRVDVSNRKVLLAPIISLSAVDELFANTVRAFYAADYAKQLKQKIHNEVERTTIVQLEQLIWSCDMIEFGAKLNEYIVQRDSEKYQQLVSKLFNTENIPLLQEKIWVMVLCKIRNSTSNQVVWNRGNMANHKECMSYEKIWDSDLTGIIPWTDFISEWNNLNTILYHNVYRDGMANRHGHANVCPRGVHERKGYWKAKIHNKCNRNNPLAPDEFDN